jgi:hypothetical protein
MTTMQILNQVERTYPNLGRYFFLEARAGKHHATVAVAPDHVQVCVHNASNRAWRGMGRAFYTRGGEDSRQAAVAAYKTPEIQAIVREAIRSWEILAPNRKPTREPPPDYPVAHWGEDML